MSTGTNKAGKVNTVKAALLGCGPRGAEHADALADTDGIEFVACCDARKGRCDELAEKHRLQRYYDARRMLESERPDLVHVVTAPGRRLEELELLEAAGIEACVIEKPVALGVADHMALSAFADSAAIKAAVCLQGRYDSHLSEACESAELGPLVSVTVSSRMNVAFQGVHMIDRALCLAADPAIPGDTRVLGTVADGWTREAGHLAPNSLLMHTVLPTGAALLGCFGAEARKAVPSPEVYMHTGIAATFESGSLYLDEFGSRHRTDRRGVHAAGTDWDTWRQTDKENLARLVKALCRWAFDGGPACETSLNRALEQWSLVLAAYQSALRGTTVAVGEVFASDLIERLAGEISGRKPGGQM